jgi:flagella basal body P-ring formation protein FlgA
MKESETGGLLKKLTNNKGQFVIPACRESFCNNPLYPPLLRGNKKDAGQAGMTTFCLLYCAILILMSAVSVGASSQNIEDSLKAFIVENYPWAEVSINDLALSGNAPETKPERVLIEKGLPGKTVFSMEFREGIKITAVANVKAFDRVVQSRGAFRKGRLLKADDIYLSLMDVTKIPKGAIRSVEEAEGKVLSRSVIANMPFTGSMLEEALNVKRGHRVVLLVESPAFGLSTLGELKENSRIGNYVKVLNLTSKKVVTGKLVDENTVKVEF